MMDYKGKTSVCWFFTSIMFLDIIDRLVHLKKTTFRRLDSVSVLSIWSNWVGFTLGRRQNPVSETLWFFKKWTRRWIMSKNIILVIIYHRHKRLNLICWFLAWFTLRTWICRRHLPSEHRMPFTRLHSAICQKIEFLTATAVSTQILQNQRNCKRHFVHHGVNVKNITHSGQKVKEISKLEVRKESHIFSLRLCISNLHRYRKLKRWLA
jgi:PIN domain nuclease of toxin-antitoxin system